MSAGAGKVVFRDVLINTGVALLPVVIMILIQKPALRQAICLKVVKGARDFAIWQTEVWRDASFSLARVYDRVRM